MASPAYDQGAVAETMPAERMLLLLGRSAQNSASLEDLLAALQDRNAPEYHRYLSPAEFAARYGPSDADLEAVRTWLQGQGFRVDKVSAGRQVLEFSGSAGQVLQAFHTAIHRYVVDGAEHFANAGAPDIPSALAPVVQGLLLGNFGARPQLHRRGSVLLDRTSHGAVPLFNDPLKQNDCLTGYCFAVTPGDFAKVYDTAPLLASGVDGSGITIGIVGDAPIDLPSVQAYRENFLPAYDATNLPNPILEGAAPTVYSSGDMTEAHLDVEEAGGVAPNAAVNFYYGANGYTSDGVDLALIRAIDDNQVSILSISFGGCESYFGDTYDAFYKSMYEQAAAQGITVVAASGDSGSAACDPPPNSLGFTQAAGGLAVSGMASTPYNVAVGGTDFYYSANATLNTLATYWSVPSSSTANNAPDWTSAKGYIPEKPWDVSDETLNQFTNDQELGAGGGGKSSCVVSTGAAPSICISGYPQPSWQVGFTQDTVRDLPDVSLFASVEGNYSFTPFCLPEECTSTDGGPNSTSAPLLVDEIGGTSVAAPAFAGILALVEQKAGSRLGQANPVLYALAKQQPSAFHDVTVGTNRVQCKAGTADCGGDGYLTGYSAKAGYDLATGLGSVDAAVLVNHWLDVIVQTTTTTLTISPTTAVHGTAQTFTVDVTGGATGGTIALLTTATGNGLQGQYAIACTAFPCTFTYAGLPGGSYNVAARFGGDATHAASTSPNVPVTITAQPSEVDIYAQVGTLDVNGVLSQTQNINGQTLVYGGLLEFTAIPLPAGIALPANPFLLPAPATGTVSVMDNGVALGAPLELNAQGNGVFNLSTLPVGQHSLVVTYSGDGSYTGSDSTKPLATPLNFTVEKAQALVVLQPTTVTVPPNTPVTLTATMSTDGSFPVDGSLAVTVSSSGGTVTLPAAPLAFSALYGASTATVTIPASALVAGKNVVTVSFGGNANLLPSAATATIQVLAANTSLSLAATPAAPTAGQTLSVTATLDWQPVANTYGITGNLHLLIDGVFQCSDSFGYLTGGSFDTVCQFPNLQPGAHTISGAYSGDPAYTPASASYTFTVPGTVPLSFGVTATPVTLPGKTMNPSGSSTVSIELTSALSSVAMFSMSCSTVGAPAGTTCSLPASVSLPAGAMQTTTLATVSLAGTSASAKPKTGAGGSLVWLAAMPVVWCWRRKRWQPFAALCLLWVVTCGLCACGPIVGVREGGGGTTTGGGTLTPGTYALQVTAQSGGSMETATILVRVQ